MSERVELDRLADYAAGLLDGTPDAVEVAHLIATDGAWAGAYAELVQADRRVRTDLLALGATAEPMPADVVARLNATLKRAVHGGPARAGERTVVSLDVVRRRRRRWAAALAAAAAGVVAFGVFGLPALRMTANDDAGFTASAGSGDAQRSEADSGKPSALAPATTGLQVHASGIDYRRETLRVAEEERSAGELASRDMTAGASKAAALEVAAPAELRRLTDPAARDACLAAVTAAYGGRAVSVDYARFEGIPALVVLLVDANSRPSRVVVAGAACGQYGSGADVRYTVTAG